MKNIALNLVLLSIPEKQKDKSKQLFSKIVIELQKFENMDGDDYKKEVSDLYFNRIQSLLMLNDVDSVSEVLESYFIVAKKLDNLSIFMQYRFIELLVGLYKDYTNMLVKMNSYMDSVADYPISECHFYRIIFDLHKEKAKNYYQRYIK